MTKLWIFSDLHLESIPYPEAFAPKKPEFDVMVVAGDIWEGDPLRGLSFISNLADGKPVIFVMGNHEHWNGLYEETIADTKLIASQLGITLLTGNAAKIAGCHFLGATLWSDYELSGYADPEAMTGEQIDISQPDSNSQLITVGDAVALHRRDRKQLEALLSKPLDGCPVVVVTHHAPHLECVPHEFHHTWPAGNSASNLSHLTDVGLVSLWVHGHLHNSVDLKRPGGTRIVCNPAGVLFSNPAFQEAYVIEL